MSFRTTLASDLIISGTALHAGVPVTMTLSPAPAGQGILFRRSDKGSAEIPARYDLVGETRLGTVIEKDGVSVGVIEHLMAAVAGVGLDDLTVTLDGPEPPILDGDALSYLVLIEKAGLKTSAAPRRAIGVLQEVRVSERDASAALHPARALSYDFLLEYDTPAIGRQKFSFAFSPADFRDLIAPARTFGFLKDLESLNRMNLARGASLENTLALDESGVVNKERQRFADEFVRHKILDAIGDMALAGAPLVARFEGVRSGHGLNNRLLRALFSDPANYELVTLP
jgi:UDP-3-O-[3-hydroxymyristoyl] N-acetylglucosamine deacetylase